MNRGILISPYSLESERMAWTQVTMLRRWTEKLPVLVLSQDYLCGMDWHALPMTQVRARRAAGGHGTPLHWFNKLAALGTFPFEETLYLDCDILPLSDPSWWFDYLGTDDLTFSLKTRSSAFRRRREGTLRL